MKLNIYFFIFILSSSSTIHPFSYDSAMYAAQKGDIKSADEQMRSIVTNSPDDADVLYDAGVLSAQLNNHSQAAAYFSRSAQCTHDDKDLCIRAHFNAGNAFVDTKDLKRALEHYDQALKIDADNEYVRHNRDRVAQMLQQEEQKQQQQDQEKNNDQQDQKDNQDQQQDDSSSAKASADKQQNEDGQHDEQDQSGDENDQQQGNEQQQKQNQKEDSGSGKKSDKQSKGEQGKDSKNGSDGEQGKQQRDADKGQQNATKDEKRNSDQGLDEKSEGAGDKGEKQESKQHGKTPEEQNKEEQSENSISSQGNQAQADVSGDALAESEALAKLDALDPWLQGILNDQELRDKEVNKRLMEAQIRQHGGKNGQNCW